MNGLPSIIGMAAITRQSLGRKNGEIIPKKETERDACPAPNSYLIFLQETAKTAVQRRLGSTAKKLGAKFSNACSIRLPLPLLNTHMKRFNIIPKSAPFTYLKNLLARYRVSSDTSVLLNTTLQATIDTICRAKSTMQMINAALIIPFFLFPANAASKHMHGITSARRNRTEFRGSTI